MQCCKAETQKVVWIPDSNGAVDQEGHPEDLEEVRFKGMRE